MFLLDAFKGIYKGIDISSDLLPMIHVHCFTRSADPIQDIKQVDILLHIQKRTKKKIPFCPLVDV